MVKNKKKKFETASTDASESGDAVGASYLFGAGAIWFAALFESVHMRERHDAIVRLGIHVPRT